MEITGPRGGVACTVVYWSLDTRAGEVNVGVISRWMVFNDQDGVT